MLLVGAVIAQQRCTQSWMSWLLACSVSFALSPISHRRASSLALIFWARLRVVKVNTRLAKIATGPSGGCGTLSLSDSRFHLNLLKRCAYPTAIATGCFKPDVAPSQNNNRAICSAASSNRSGYQQPASLCYVPKNVGQRFQMKSGQNDSGPPSSGSGFSPRRTSLCR